MQTRKLTIALGALIVGASFGPAALAWNNTSSSKTQQMNQQVQKMDNNSDNQVSKSEYDNYWKQQFQTADANNDGNLSKQECQTASEKINGGMKISQASFDRMWRSADSNNDGSLSQSEDLAYHDQIFSQADNNNDGRLTKAEIHSAVQNRDESLASL
ncbi:MAG TPA: EF-hand domain-containing protein [Rhodanobacteraceae bacterium]|nr:EF-hand domain-containing protein [Rhodanobacteraceae bacterium]